MAAGQVAKHEAVDRKAPDVEFGLAGHSLAVDRHRRPQSHPLLDSFVVLAKRKSFILKWVCAAALVAIVIALLLPDTYTANTRVLPVQQYQSMVAELLTQLNRPGTSNLYRSDLYVAMLHSEAIANRLIDRFSLMKVYGANLRVEARHTLADRTGISLGKEGVISISVDDRSPERAVDLTNGYVEELEALAKTMAMAEAGRRKEFLASRVKAAGDELANAEQALKKTEERTGLVLFDPQTKILIEASAGMRAHVAAQEVRVQWMRSFAAPGNPELMRATQQLAELRNQESKLELGGGRPSINVPLGKMPAARLEYEQRDREVRFRETLFKLLTQQLEAAKLDEAKADVIVQPAVQTLDRAVPPERNSAPHRFLIVFFITLLALVLAVLSAFAMENFDRAKLGRKPPTRVPAFTFHLQEQPENVRKSS